MVSAVRAPPSHHFIPLYLQLWPGGKKNPHVATNVYGSKLDGLESRFISQFVMKSVRHDSFSYWVEPRHVLPMSVLTLARKRHCAVPLVRNWKVGQVLWKATGATLPWKATAGKQEETTVTTHPFLCVTERSAAVHCLFGFLSPGPLISSTPVQSSASDALL